MNKSDLTISVVKSIENQSLFHKKDGILLAVSGGADSMTMLYILARAGFRLQVAHVNYKLRAQSDKEEKLVRSWCMENNIPCHVKVLSPAEVRDLEAGNLQEKARNIRMHFFEELMRTQGLKCLCTAHHRNDRAETFLLSLFRGTGLRGLVSMKIREGAIRRPMLNCSKDEILHYANDKAIPYLEDESNEQTKYQRNYIRHELIPLLQQRWPGVEERITDNITILEDQFELYLKQIEVLKKRYFKLENEKIRIGPVSQLTREAGAVSLLHEILYPMGFTGDQIKNMLEKTDKTGRYFPSPAYQVLLDRDFLYLKEKKETNAEKVEIPGPGIYRFHDKYSIRIEVTEEATLSQNPSCELIDAGKVKFPWQLDYWTKGDSFCPFGMGGRKKLLSDFFTDLKIDRFTKAQITVLKGADGEIIWIPNYRLDERYRIDETSSSYLKLTYEINT